MADTMNTTLTDKLTGLYTKPFFEELLKKEVLRSARYARPLSILVLEIQYDYFIKEFNMRTELGYRIMREAGKCIEEVARDVDFGGRISGEVLALALPETDRQGGKIAAERLRQAMEEREFTSGGLTTDKCRAALNIGMASFPENGKNPQALLLEAETAMTAARNDGGNLVRLAAGDDENSPEKSKQTEE